MTGSSLTDAQAGRLWDALQVRVARTMGQVSIVKFMQAGDTETARALWIRHVRDYAAALPSGDALRVGASTEDPVIEWGGTTATLDVSSVDASEGPHGAWRTSLLPRWAPVFVGVAGAARWGERWDEAVAARAGDAPTVVIRVEDDRPLPWFAQDPREPGLWPAFATEAGARAAAAAIAVGHEGMAELYDRWKEPRP